MYFLLPEALMMDIWLRLSIKSTVRFRCVSKPWCASLSDPRFIYKNLTFSSYDDDDDHLLLVNDRRPYYPLVSHDTLIATPLQLPSDPPHNFGVEDVITPPLDDMVCFYQWGEEYVGVWNLATGETKVIPPPEFDDDDGYIFTNITLGFGFDEKRKEYKIVQVLEKSKQQYRNYEMARDSSCVAYVYTLSSSSSSNNSWRKVGEPTMPSTRAGHVDEIYSRTYGDGTFYWGSRNLIVSFDMSTEVFNYISIPFLDGGLSQIEVIHKLKDGSMLMITVREELRFTTTVNSTGKYRIWALLELGVIQSWTNLLVNDLDGKRGVPLGFWRNEVVVKSHSNACRLIISDPFKRGEIKEIQTDESVNITRCLVWTKGKKAAAASSSSLSGLRVEEHE